jgi:hypothetical protein
MTYLITLYSLTGTQIVKIYQTYERSMDFIIMVVIWATITIAIISIDMIISTSLIIGIFRVVTITFAVQIKASSLYYQDAGSPGIRL